MRNPKQAFYKKRFLRGSDLGKAILEDEVRRRLDLKPFFSAEDKFIFINNIIPAQDERRAFNKYVKLLEYLDDRWKQLKINKIELDRQIAWRVCFFNGILAEARRLLNEPIVITAKMDEGNTTIFEDNLHLIRKDKVVASFSERDIGSPKRVKLTPLQERQRELNGVALLVRGGKNRAIDDRFYEIPTYATLEQLRTDKVNMPDPDFKNIQYRTDSIKAILMIFNAIGAEVGLDIPKAYGDNEVDNILHNARAYNSLFGETLAKLTATGIRCLPTNFKKYVKLINLDKEPTQASLDLLKAELHNLKAFDFNVGRGVGDRLEKILFKF